MDHKKLEKLRQEHDRLKFSQGDVSGRQLRGLATRLGRKLKKGKQTGEPMFVSEVFRELRPIPIPAHKQISPGTKRKVLTWLESDFFAWDEKLCQQENQDKGSTKKGK